MQTARVLGVVGFVWTSGLHSAHAAHEYRQESEKFTPQIAVYGELAGAALLGSVNVELRPLEFLNLRAGGVVLPVPLLEGAPLTIVGATVMAGNERHHAELGFNYVHVWVDDDDARFLNPTLGYRYQPNAGGFLFRATVTPLLRANDPADALPWVGLSFGWCGSL